MKKRYLVVGVVLGILLLCGGVVGYGKLDEFIRKNEMKQRMAEQKIVFMCTRSRYSENFVLLGYFIDSNGDKCYFDATDEFSKRPYAEHTNDNVYEYLCAHMEEYEKTPFLQEEQLYDCYAHLELIDKDAEVVHKSFLRDSGMVDLHGIRPSESGEWEFILLVEDGDLTGYNPDENAQRIVEIIGKDTWSNYTKEDEQWRNSCNDDRNCIRLY